MSPLGSAWRLLRGTSAASAVANVAVTNGFILGLNVLTGVLTARLLGPAGRGELAALLLWPQFLGYAFAFALPSAVIYLARRDASNKRGIAGTAILLSLVGGLCAAAVGTLALPALLRQADHTLLSQARWMMVFTPFATVSTMLTALIQLEERFHFYNLLRYAPLVLTFVALVILGSTGGLSPLSGALAYLLPGVPVFLWMCWWVWRSLRPTLVDWRIHARPLVSYGARAYGGEAAGTVLAQVDKLVLVNLLTASAFGVYVVLFNLSRVITLLASAIAPVLFPRTAGRPPNEVCRSTERALAVATPLCLLGALGFAAFGGIALRMLYGPAFAGGHAALAVLSLEAALFSIAHVLTQPFLALDRPGVITLIQSATVLLGGAAMWWLAPLQGVNGAAAALLLTTALRTAFTQLAYRVFPGTRPPRVVPRLRDSLQGLRDLRGAA